MLITIKNIDFFIHCMSLIIINFIKLNTMNLKFLLVLLITINAVYAKEYEVWVLDQSDTTADGGGTLYIYDGSELNGHDAGQAIPEVIDFAGSVRSLCLSQTTTAPRRPHMMAFNKAQTHAIISFVATGHVLFMDAETRTPLTCIDVGVQAHAAIPSHDESFVIVANQAGKLLQRIITDYSTNTFFLDIAATLNLASNQGSGPSCVTPTGVPCEDSVLRPDNQPVCPVIDSTDSLVFVTLAGGGLFVVDPHTSPMRIIGEYDKQTVHPNGCGGTEAHGRMYINSGGPLETDLYSFPLTGYATTNPANVPAPGLVFSHDGTNSDSHGMVKTKHDRYLWVAERFSNIINIVDIDTEQLVDQIDLVGNVSPDPAPDLMHISPNGNRIFFTLRGPIPLSANNPAFNNSVGATPGLGMIRVQGGGRNGVFYARAPISNVVNGVETADPHGLGIRVIEDDDD